MGEIKLDARNFCFILTEYLLKKLHVIYCFKVQHVSSFAIIEKEKVPYSQKCSIIT